MKRGTLILTGASLSLVLGAAAFGYSIVGARTAAPAPRQVTKLATVERALDGACSSATTYDRLKTKLFDDALDVGDVDPAKLDLLAGSTVVRMEDPILKAKDEELGVTVCTGRFVVELPPGAEKAFDGRRRLEAEIEYAAQVAADGSGIVYQLRGAEPITYRLAAFDLRGLPPLPPAEALPALAQAEPILMAPELVPAAMTSMPEPEAKPLPDPVLAAKAAEPVKTAALAKAKEAPRPALAKAEKPRSKPAETAVAATKKKDKPAVEVAAKAKSVKAPAKAAAKTKTAKPSVKLAAKSGKESTKVAEKAKSSKSAAKSKTVAKAKPPVQTAKAKAVRPSPKPPVKVAKAAPKPAPKPAVVKVAKAAPPPKPAPVRKAAAPVRAVSRDLPCGAGRPLSERLMCANPALVTRERRMMSVYYSALDNADGSTRRVLQETAGNFQAYRNNCRTENCLAEAFDERIAEIRDIMADMR